MDDADPVLINKYTEMAQKFTARYFGRHKPALPSKKLLAFKKSLVTFS